MCVCVCVCVQTVISVSIPLILLAVSVPVWALIYLVKYRARRHKLKQPAPPEAASLGRFVRTRMVVTAIGIIFYAYPNVTTALLYLFSCPAVSGRHGSCSSRRKRTTQLHGAGGWRHHGIAWHRARGIV